MRFLNDAHERGVLRTVGPVYQFRHARLQDRLAGQASSSPWDGPLRPSNSDTDSSGDSNINIGQADRTQPDARRFMDNGTMSP
jgi:hypothetical protein